MKDAKFSDLMNTWDFYIGQATQERCFDPQFPLTDRIMIFWFGSLNMVKFDP